MSQNTILLIVVVGLILLVLAFIVMSIRRKRGDVFEERLGRYTEPGALLTLSDEFEKEEQPVKKKDDRSLVTRVLDSVISSRGFAEGWKTALARADLKLTVGEYFASHIASMIGMFLFFLFVISPGQLVGAIIGAGIGLLIPRIYVNFKQQQRMRQFENQLPDLLSLWVNSLRSGYSVLQSLEAISREAPNPTSGEIKRVVQEVQLGIPMDQALDHMLTRMPSDDFDLVITAINIQREVGGNLAEILEVIGHTIRERIKIKGEIRVLTAQGRISGYVITGLPIALALFLYLINRDYMSKLVENRGCGWPMLAVSLGMIGIGWSAIQRIVDIDV